MLNGSGSPEVALTTVPVTVVVGKAGCCAPAPAARAGSNSSGNARGESRTLTGLPPGDFELRPVAARAARATTNKHENRWLRSSFARRLHEGVMVFYRAVAGPL